MISHHRITLLLLLLHCCYIRGCPSQCQCFLGSKVICSEERMYTFPQGLSLQVRELIIITSGLTSIPSNSFLGSPQLTKLAIISNPLRGISPLAFSGLTELGDLEVSGNTRLEAVQLGTLDHLGNLTRLLLNNNELLILEKGLFDHLPKLETLEIRGNAFIWLPASLFGKLKNLHSLDVSMNKITSVEATLLSDLTQLQSLKLGYNQISSLPSDMFKYVPGLKELSLQNNNISNLPEGLFTFLNKLEELNLRDNQLTDVRAGTFPSTLKELNLQGNHLTLLSLGNLPLLTDLVLSKNRFTDLPSDLLKNVTSLEQLDLSENQLSSLPATLFSGLSRIISIHLHKNNLTSLEPDVFQDQVDMERLTLSQNRLQNLPHGFFEPFLETRNVITLRGNPWNCDCNFSYLYTWLEFGGYLVEDLGRTYCKGPAALKGQSLMSVERDQLVCSNNSTIPKPVPADSLQPLDKETFAPNQTNQCILQKNNDVYSIKCTVTKCSNLKIQAHIYGPDGSTTNYILNKEWSVTQCVNGTRTPEV
ncbi:carboxypeptidase N subunit 2 [Alosa sapidissima]|uniref:carboxypeptidase N subunit 2 n=1 Tax=Alosa sapidissima TaxID=34773 RepID=UPI001C085B4D|nr:carboxypeptidase N subunit 2 [Alosa sapidissima]